MSEDDFEYNLPSEIDIMIKWFTLCLTNISEEYNENVGDLFKSFTELYGINKNGLRKMIDRFTTYSEEEIDKIMEKVK